MKLTLGLSACIKSRLSGNVVALRTTLFSPKKMDRTSQFGKSFCSKWTLDPNPVRLIKPISGFAPVVFKEWRY